MSNEEENVHISVELMIMHITEAQNLFNQIQDFAHSSDHTPINSPDLIRKN